MLGCVSGSMRCWPPCARASVWQHTLLAALWNRYRESAWCGLEVRPARWQLGVRPVTSRHIGQHPSITSELGLPPWLALPAHILTASRVVSCVVLNSPRNSMFKNEARLGALRSASVDHRSISCSGARLLPALSSLLFFFF